MDIQEQNRLWKYLSEEKKKEYRDKYNQKVQNLQDPNYNDYLNGQVDMILDMFGVQNLRVVKTWADVENLMGSKDRDTFSEFLSITASLPFIAGNPVYRKLIATYRIAILISFGYGGIISDEEWEDSDVPKYRILPVPNSDEVTGYYTYGHKTLIAFHTEEQMKEFMSYPENRDLIREYHMVKPKDY